MKKLTALFLAMFAVVTAGGCNFWPFNSNSAGQEEVKKN